MTVKGNKTSHSVKIPAGPVYVFVEAGPNGKWEMHSGTSTAAQQRREFLLTPTHLRAKSMPRFEDREYVGYHMTHVPRTDDDDDDALPSLFPEFHGRGPMTFDAQDYLDALLNIKTQEDALAFLGRYGNPESQHETTFDRIRELQGLLRQAAVTPTHQWWTLMPEWEEPANIETNWHEKGPPEYISRYKQGVMACFAQIFFERKAGTKFAWCELESCGRLFHKSGKGPGKRFCCPAHQHLALVHRGRKRAKKAAKKRRTANK